MIGSTVGKYRIIEQLGKGGMGTVYRAIDETLDREVAIKALNADLLSEESLQRFRSEAVLLAKLNHRHIAGIYELTRQGSDLLMVMEYVKGETCEKLLARSGPLPITRAVALCDQILDALEHAHASGIVHRDLKPGNVMVTESGDVKVTDFGIARVAGSAHLTMDGYMMGTPAYMAPEQVRGEEVDRRMDLYSAAVMLYRLVTSRLPFEADSAVTLIHSQLSDPPTPPRQFRPDLPDWMDAVLARGLAKAPGDRFQSAAEFREALQRGLGGTFARPFLAEDNAETIAPTPTPTALRRVATIDRAVPSGPPSQALPAHAAASHSEGTVTLRTPQLAVAGGLLALLVIGVGILAYVALRRPVMNVIAPNLVSTPGVAAPGTTPPAAASTSSTADTSAASNSPGTNAPTPPATAVTAPPAPASTPVTPTPAPPSPAPTSTPTAGSAKAAAPKTNASPTGSSPAASPRPSAATATPTPTAPPADESSAGRAGAKSGAGASAALPTASFGDLKVIVANGAKTKDVDALLNLEPDKLVVRDRDNGEVVQSEAYKSIAALTYAHAKAPRWQEGDGVAAVPKSFGGSGFFLRSSRHWLTLQSKNEFIILRLEDRNVIPVMTSLEQRTGIKVQRTED
jgi:serine/threonine-protein kinase